MKQVVLQKHSMHGGELWHDSDFPKPRMKQPVIHKDEIMADPTTQKLLVLFSTSWIIGVPGRGMIILHLCLRLSLSLTAGEMHNIRGV